MNLIQTTIILAICFILIDSLWFAFTVKSLYLPSFKDIQGSEVEFNIFGGIYAWLLLGLSISVFVIPHAKTECQAMAMGALMGLIIYGVYNGTNMATFKKWNKTLFVADNLWGIIVSSIVALIGFKFLK